MDRNLRLTVLYDGTPFKGWQRQAGCDTVQGTLETKLGELCGHAVSLLVAGRTDAGVHALGQVCNFHTSSRLPVSRLHRVLNQMLPHSVRVTKVREAPAAFHATYHARSKLYRYCLLNSPDYTVFDRHFYHHVRQPLDVSAMRHCARHLEGRRDFSAFRGPLGRDRDPVRNLKKVSVLKKGRFLHLEYEGESFLHQMVRILSGTLLYAGLGKFRPKDIPVILESKDRRKAGPTLPPTGLFLVKVEYPRTFKPVRTRSSPRPPEESE